MVGLALSLLGPFEVTRNGNSVTWSGGDATRALLAYLAMHAGGRTAAGGTTSASTELRREVLAGLLWPDVPQTAALANLRQALHRLRASIGDSEGNLPCLTVTRQTITCHPPADQSPADQSPADQSPADQSPADQSPADQSPADQSPSPPDASPIRAFWLDVAAFRAALDAVDAHPHRRLEACTACTRRLEDAVALYRGEFLAGFSFPSDLYEGWLAQALDASATTSATASLEAGDEWTPLRAGALNWAGTLAVYSDPGAAAALQRESLALWREMGDERGIGYTLCELGITEYMLGDLDRARPQMEAGITMLREAQDTLSLARALYWYALIPLSEGDLESTRIHTKESARLSRQIGALAHTATTIRVLGHIAEAQGEYAVARAAYEEDLRLARQARDRLCIEQCLNELGGVAYRQGDDEGARGYWRAALELYRSSGNRRATANTVLALGGLALCRGDDQGAESLLDEGLALARELADPPLLAWALHERGQLALDRGERSYAVALFSEGLDVSQEIEHPYLAPVCLAGLAAAKEESARAVRLYGAAQALLEATDTHLDRGDQAALDGYLAAARAELEEAAFARAWAEGWGMAAQGVAHVVAYARGGTSAEG